MLLAGRTRQRIRQQSGPFGQSQVVRDHAHDQPTWFHTASGPPVGAAARAGNSLRSQAIPRFALHCCALTASGIEQGICCALSRGDSGLVSVGVQTVRVSTLPVFLSLGCK
jgi:hypothetical protein